MKPGLILVGVAGVALVAIASGKSTKKNPIQSTQGMPLGGYSNIQSYYDGLRSQVGWGQQTNPNPTPQAQATWNKQSESFRQRQIQVSRYLSALPPDVAKGVYGGAAPSSASKQSFLIYRPGNNVHGTTGPQPWGWYLTDEFGRPFEGWGYGGSPFAGLMPLVQAALPLVPGIGPAASAALAGAIALGQGKSLTDASLAAARAALPPYAQLAFDAGIGVAQGQPIDQAAIQALEKRYPGSQAAFNKAKQLYKSVS